MTTVHYLSRKRLQHRLRARARARGMIYVEYLIVTGFVTLVLMVTFYHMGPRVVHNFRGAVKDIVEHAP